jgi:ribosomal-protein-alanine N-acetyltransferase
MNDLTTIKINKNIELVPMDSKYVQDIFDNFTLQVIKYLPRLKPSTDIKNTEDFVLDTMTRMSNKTDFNWIVLQNKHFIGCVGMRGVKTKNGDFGYWLKTSEQGKGLGKVIAKSVFDWCFENLDLNTVKYPVDKRNLPSIKIIESLGGKVVKQYLAGEENSLDILEYHVSK